jgi:hypothetical protein
MKIKIVKKIFILFVLLSIVVLGFKVTDLQNKIESYESDSVQINVLLTSDNSAAGYSCGVLKASDAKEFLQSEVVRSFRQSPTDKVREDKPAQELIFWSDSCRYEDSANNSRYVEYYVTTFQTDEAAAKAFPDFLQTVNDAKNIPVELSNQTLIYDAGVYYLLSSNRVIQVAASDGNPSESQNFSRGVLDYLMFKN